jgi:RND family efflux transporter MFP subunit
MSQFKQVTAPFDGVITSRYIDLGNLVTAGSTSSTTPLYVMTQNDPMRVFVDVPQSAAADLMQSGAPVTLRTSTGEMRTYAGTVARTSEAVNAQARTFRVEVDLPNTDKRLVPGMYLKMDFDLAPRGLVQVPAATLLFRASGPQVAQVEHGKIRFRPVTIARDDGVSVELGSGVAIGDKLVLNLSSQIGEGQAVTVNAMESGSAAPSQLTAERSSAAAAERSR